ncbi:peptide chain release factor N(5)-glutamine methyltransferase [Streptococcus tangpeifui]|uniref:peptide chain release factor N(5)-glutamine methyltransferase n=1 Tax=Streptococcus tangpeifui TaxID=2709400 RepID=UPI0013EA9710|nr:MULTISPECIES: peptide chain release factor N(5)-glutamine methyltransferase [unclassified Streptococcus]
MTYAQLFLQYELELEKNQEEPESLTFTFRHLKGLDMTEFVLLLRQKVSEGDRALIDQIAKRLLAHEPAQYIIGYETFHDLSFKVDKRVLIPRPETAELVDLVLEENADSRLSLLDLGTGSGAIAVSLAHSRLDWQVMASDISQDALDLAGENALANKVQVDFRQSDVFDQIEEVFDIIVSNPPYIAQADIDEVGLNVQISEPHLALFAKEQGLAVYRRIAEEAKAHLNPDGKIYLEIGYKQGQAVSQMFKVAFPDKRVRVLPDQFGQDRMVVVDNG